MYGSEFSETESPCELLSRKSPYEFEATAQVGALVVPSSEVQSQTQEVHTVWTACESSAPQPVATPKTPLN